MSWNAEQIFVISLKYNVAKAACRLINKLNFQKSFETVTIYKYYVCYLLKLNNLLINDMNLAFNRPKPQQHVP